MKLIRILIVEDSLVQAKVIEEMFNQQADMEVVGHAKNGREAIKLAELLKPDLITMDIEMPEMDGLEATRQIMRHTPTPIIILSTHVQDKDLKVTFHAFDYGAVWVMQKPGDISQPDMAKIAEELVETVRAMAEVKVVSHRHKKKQHHVPWEIIKPKKRTHYKIVALGCSTGGPIALQEILSHLPPDYPLPIIIVQHMFEHFTLAFIDWLSKQTELTLKLAEEGEMFKSGYVYFSPYDFHLLVEKKENYLAAHLSRSKKFVNFRPSVTVTFQSLAEACGENVIAGVLTGLGDDGADGLKALHEKGAFTFVQKPETCVVASMPQAALNIGATTQVIPLDKIATQLEVLAKKAR